MQPSLLDLTTLGLSYDLTGDDVFQWKPCLDYKDILQVREI